ncbi:kinase-like protein [Paxillus ammoniavirescens]|nr:kinase-like protein [Paxillus ammoniavirescens]
MFSVNKLTPLKSSPPRGRPRNVIFFGEIGAGKSSAINLIAGSSVAGTNNDVEACTRVSASYPATIRNEPFILWDTHGLSDASFARSLFNGSAEKKLNKFLQERHQKREIDLLVYCIHGGHKALLKYYNTFCLKTRRLAVPVVIVVTNLEREKNMEDWWERNESVLQSRGMEFDGHACITALPDNHRGTESEMTLHDLITRKYHWRAACGGSYIGSPLPSPQRVPDVIGAEAQSTPGTSPYVDSSIVATPPGKSKIGKLMEKFTPNWGAKQNNAGERSESGTNGVVHRAPMPPALSYHTAYERTPQHSQPTGPVDGPAPHIQVNHPAPSIITDHTRDTLPSQSDSTTSHFHSLLSSSSATSYSSRSESHPQTLFEERYEDLTAVVKRREQYASRSGGFGDIWECDLTIEKIPRKVAVKAVRARRTDFQNLADQEKKLRRELKVWAELQDENVVKLLGVVSGFGVLPSIVCPWFSNGSLTSYLPKHEAMDLSGRQGLLLDIASGLCYLHSRDIVHGDLHGGNVLVDENGRACLTDFGLSVILQEFPGTSYLKSSVCGALRYADPELVRQVLLAEGEVVYPRKPSDVYSFGGLVLYVLTGKQPYEGIKEFMLPTRFSDGIRPSLPVDNVQVSPQSKSLIQRCWSPEESTRPLVEEIIASLQEMLV